MTDRRDLPGYWAQGDGMHFPDARSPGHAVRLYRAAFAASEVAVNSGKTVDGLEVPALRRRVAELEGEVRRLTGELTKATIDTESPTCEHEGCTSPGEPCWLPDDPEDAPSCHYCVEHMHDGGFCPGCRLFWGGVESFEFRASGLCDNCASQEEAEDEHADDPYAWMGEPDFDVAWRPE